MWEALLPPGYEQLPPRLARVDALLDGPAFFESYRAHFSAEEGDPDRDLPADDVPLESDACSVIYQRSAGDVECG